MYGATPVGGNVSLNRQRRNHVIDVRFITNAVLSVDSLQIYLSASLPIYVIYIYIYICVCVYIDHMYIEHTYIYICIYIHICAGGLSRHWFERESLIIQIRPYRLYFTNYKVYYVNSVLLSYRWNKITENVNHKYDSYHRCIWKMSSVISPSMILCWSLLMRCTR